MCCCCCRCGPFPCLAPFAKGGRHAAYRTASRVSANTRQQAALLRVMESAERLKTKNKKSGESRVLSTNNNHTERDENKNPTSTSGL